jgi:surface protein
MEKIDREYLRELIMGGISSDELNSNYDYSHIRNMNYLLTNIHHIKTIPFLKTENVTTMMSMFQNCTKLEEIPLIDTSNVRCMSYMFYNCSNLRYIPNLSTASLGAYANIFRNCVSVERIDMLINKINYHMCGSDDLIMNNPEYFI